MSLKTSALSARGLGVQDVVEVISVQSVNHNLSFLDLGFQPGTTRPIPDPVNFKPDANVDFQQLTVGETVTGNVLLNDTDGDGDALSARLLTSSSSFGNIQFSSNGDYTFTSTRAVDNFHSVIFTYEVTDGILTDTSTIQLTVNAPPPAPPTPDANATLITATAGDDVVVGTSGANIIFGGDGSDVLTGGAGRDIFVFGANRLDGDTEIDRITDFNPDEDSIVIEGLNDRVQNVFFQDGQAVITLFGTSDQIRVDTNLGTTGVRENTFTVAGDYLSTLSTPPSEEP